MFSMAVVILLSLSVPSISPEQKQKDSKKSSEIVKVGVRNATSGSFFDDIQGIAVYEYDRHSSLLARPEYQKAIDFNITKPEEIERVLEALDYEETKANNQLVAPTASIFFRNSYGKIVSGKIVGGWQFLMIGDNWNELYPIPDAGIRVLRSKLKTCPKQLIP